MPGARRLRVGRLFGVPVYVHASWLVVFTLMVWTLATGYFPAAEPGRSAIAHWTSGVLAALLLFASILLHEAAHAVVARSAGLETRAITLFLFGGLAETTREPRDGRTEVRIAFAGPLASLALAALFAAAAAPEWAPRAACRYLAWINVAVALFNLIPALPLDGGRILRGVLWKRLGKPRATEAAATCGTALALAFLASGALAIVRGTTVAGIWYVALGWFLQQACAAAHGQARLEDRLSGMCVRDVMLTRVETLPAHLSLQEAARDHFRHTGFGAYPVVRGEEVVGLLHLRDVLRVRPDSREALSVQGAMRPLSSATAATPDEPLVAALARMTHGEAPRLVVVEDGRLAGFLTMSAVARQLAVRDKLAA